MYPFLIFFEIIVADDFPVNSEQQQQQQQQQQQNSEFLFS